MEKSNKKFLSLTGHIATIKCIDKIYHQNTDFIVSGSYDKTIRIWKVTINSFDNYKNSTGECIKIIDNNEKGISSILIQQFNDYGYLISGSTNSKIKIYDIYQDFKEKEIISCSNHHAKEISKILSLDNDTIVTTSFDKYIKVWDLNKLIVKKSILTKSMIFSAKLLNSETIVCGHQYGLVSIYNILTNELLLEIKEQKESIWCIEILNDIIFSGCINSFIKCFNSSNGDLKYSLLAHNGIVYDFKYLGNGFFASCGRESYVKIWYLTNN